MRLTKDNLEELIVGQKVWIARNTRLPERIIYVGIFEDYHLFGGGSEPYKIYIDNSPQYPLSQASTSYEECCIIMRELFIDLIGHYNTHQFKDNPININND